MSDGSDFVAFVVARWPSLVRTLALLGHDGAAGHAAAVAGLARCQPSWDRVRDEGDAEAHVYQVVLDQVARGTSAGEPVVEADPPLSLEPMLTDRSERVELLTALEQALAQLETDLRTVLVLRYAAGLEADQVTAVVGRPLAVVREQEWRGVQQLAHAAEWPRLRPGGFDPTEVFLDAGEVIPVRSPPVDDVVERAAATRQRRRWWAGAAVAAVVLVLAVGTWLGARPAGPQLPESTVTAAQNPASIEWYANHELHLPDVTVELPQVTDLVSVADGVVYVDADGLVVQVRGDGSLVKLGETVPGTPLIASAERSWAAWVQAGETEDRLVVSDVVRREQVASTPVERGATPVALDGDEVHYTTPGHDWSWQPLAGDPISSPGGDLLDVASGVQVSQVDDGDLRITQPLFNVEVTVPGEGAILSSEGDFVLTKVDEPQPETVALYEAASGDLVEVGLAPEEIAVQSAFDAEDAAVFLVEHRANEPEPGQDLRLSTTGPTIMRSCEFEFFEPECRTVTQFASNFGQPLLPH